MKSQHPCFQKMDKLCVLLCQRRLIRLILFLGVGSTIRVVIVADEYSIVRSSMSVFQQGKSFQGTQYIPHVSLRLTIIPEARRHQVWAITLCLYL